MFFCVCEAQELSWRSEKCCWDNARLRSRRRVQVVLRAYAGTLVARPGIKQLEPFQKPREVGFHPSWLQ